MDPTWAITHTAPGEGAMLTVGIAASPRGAVT